MVRWLIRICAVSLAVMVIAGQPRTIGALKRHRTPPDSFLKVTANSVPEFIAEVRNNPMVRQRLAKHFGISEKQLITYLEHNITSVTVKESKRYPVWGVTRTGRIYRSSTYYRRGWRAFGLKNGTPLFKWSCGNPLVSQLPRVPAPIAKARPAPRAPRLRPPPALVDRPETIAALVTQPTELVPTSPTYVMAVPQAAAPATSVAVSKTVPAWLLLPLIRPHEGGPTPTPEPGTVVIVVTGGMLAAALRRRKSRASAGR